MNCLDAVKCSVVLVDYCLSIDVLICYLRNIGGDASTCVICCHHASMFIMMPFLKMQKLLASGEQVYASVWEAR